MAKLFVIAMYSTKKMWYISSSTWVMCNRTDFYLSVKLQCDECVRFYNDTKVIYKSKHWMELAQSLFLLSQRFSVYAQLYKASGTNKRKDEHLSSRFWDVSLLPSLLWIIVN